MLKEKERELTASISSNKSFSWSTFGEDIKFYECEAKLSRGLLVLWEWALTNGMGFGESFKYYDHES